MSTKAELEARIVELQATIGKQAQALKRLSQRRAVWVALPNRSGNFSEGAAPYLEHGRWGAKVVEVAAECLRKHNLGDRLPGVSGKGEADFAQDHYSATPRVVVPAEVAEVLIDLLNACASFAQEAYAAGVAQGQDLLVQLAAGKITNAQLEERLERERDVVDRNDYKRYKIQDYRDL